MDKSLLTKLIGFPATLIHGDTLVLDRWRWLKRRLPQTACGERLLDIGCGTGAFTIGAALRGYDALGLSWDERNQQVAGERAQICKAQSARFEILDIRSLDTRKDLLEQFDVAVCCENIEHVLDDFKLFQDMAACLKPGGRLLLTTPYFHYRPINREDNGPFSQVEDGGHVRRGYTKAMLSELCDSAGLVIEEFSFTSGLLSQKITALLRLLLGTNHLMAWLAILPLRIFPPLLDAVVTPALRYPSYSICLEAYKPRISSIHREICRKD